MSESLSTIRFPNGLYLRRGPEGYQVMKVDGSMLCDGMGSREVFELRDILAEAYTRGQREMRERCATVAERTEWRHRDDANQAAERDQPMKWSESDGAAITAERIAAAIRSLPIADATTDAGEAE